jgi:hypothetical protein
VATWGAHYVLDVAKLSAGGIVAGPLAVAGGDYPTAVLWHSQRGLVAVALLLMLFAIAFWAARGPSAWPHKAAPRPIGVDALVIAAVAHLVAAATLLPGQAGPWYWGLELLAIAAVATQLCVHASSSRQLIWSAVLVQGVAGPLVFVGIIQAISSGKFDDRRSFASTMWQLHVAVQKTVPGDAPIGSCNAGALGFMSERSIVNLDGLVNDWTFLEARRRGAVRDWVDSAGIRWFADCVPRERQSEYRRHLGYGEDEVEVLFRSPSAKCEGFLWRLGPKKRLSSGPADGQVSHFENTDAGHELSVAAGKAAR